MDITPNNPDARHQRAADLRDNLQQDLALLKEYEDALRYSDDPQRRARYRREIEQLRQSVKGHQREYEELQERLADLPFPERQEIAAQLRQIRDRLDALADRTGKYETRIGSGVRGVAIGDGATVVQHIHPLSSPLTPEETAGLRAVYRTRVLEQTRYVTLSGIPLPSDHYSGPRPFNVPLDKVYIRIQATRQKTRPPIGGIGLGKPGLDQEDTRVENRNTRSFLERVGLGVGQRPVPRDMFSAFRRMLTDSLYGRGKEFQTEQRPEPIDPQEALLKYSQLVILGAPGAGKSTLLRYMAHRAAEEEAGRIPVLVSLRDFAAALGRDSTLSLCRFALDRAAGYDEKMRQVLEELAASGQVIWLVDALDEAHDWADECSRQTEQLPGGIVLTSRPVGYRGTGLESFRHFELLPLTLDNVNQFLEDWFGLLAELRGEDLGWARKRVSWLQQQLAERPRLQPLTRSPLLLTFMVLLAGEDPAKNLPTQRVELYRCYIDDLLNSWEVRRWPRSGVTGEPALTLGPLCGSQARTVALRCFYYLGWALHLAYYGGKPKQSPTRRTLVQAVTGYLEPDWKQGAESIAKDALRFWEEAGLLEAWRVQGVEFLAFRHLTFQEYAASWGIAAAWQQDRERAWDFLRPRLHHYAWREPALLLVGTMDQENLNDLGKRLLRGVSAFERDLHRDLRLAGELLAEGAMLEDQLQQRILGRLERLAQSHPRKIVMLLFLAYLILPGTLASLNVLPPPFLLEIIRVVFLLIFILPLGSWVSEKLRIDHLWWLPATFIEGLLTLPIRLDKFLGDPSQAMAILARAGPGGAASLQRCLQKGAFEARCDAARALGESGDPGAVPALVAAMYDDCGGKKNWRRIVAEIVREPAAEALGLINDPRAVQALTEGLQDSNPDIRRVAAMGLARTGDYQAVPALIQSLRDDYGMVRMEVVRTLGEIGDIRAVPALIQALQDCEPFVPLRVAQALGKIGDPRAVPVLTQALRDRNRDLRWVAAESLGQIGDPTAVPMLIQALQRSFWASARRASAAALGQIGDPRAVPALTQARRDRDKEVRRVAAHALEQISEHSTVPVPAPATHNWDIPMMAPESLAQSRASFSIIELLPHLWKDDFYHVALDGYINSLTAVVKTRWIVFALWWLLGKVRYLLYYEGRKRVFHALEQASNRLVMLEVESGDYEDPLGSTS